MRAKRFAPGPAALVLALVAVLLLQGRARAADVQWETDGVGVRSEQSTANAAVNPEIVSDGSGGAIVTWPDFRSATRWNIYAQRVDTGGRRLWATDGVLVRGQPGTPDNGFNSRITGDGAGGAIIAWQDHRAGKWDIYAQRVSAAGECLWAADGVAVRALPGTPGDANYPRIISDGAGGAIIAWHDGRSGSKCDIYAQRVTSSGSVSWLTDGVAVRALPDTQGDATYVDVVSDGSGGAIVSWRDYRSGNKWDIYAQRVDSGGQTRWTSEGVGVRSSVSSRGDATLQRIASDGSGGAVVTWQDYRSLYNYEIYAQRVDAAGRRCWASDGKAISGGGGTGAYAINPDISEGSAGGAVITWQENRTGGIWEIYAQRLDQRGNPAWNAGGVNVSNNPRALGDAQDPRISLDPSGGAVITWRDYRSGKKWDIYAQGVDPSGKRLWTAYGIAVRSGSDKKNDSHNQQITVGSPEGFVVAWMDNRSETKWDIYAQKVSPATSSFYFAEGFTGDNFQEYLCIGNPGERDAVVDVSYIFSDGTTRDVAYDVPRESRVTIDVNAAAGTGREVSIEVRSAEPGLTVERPMYFDYMDRWSGGSDVFGASSPAKEWYFAEGTTLSGFDQYVTVLNPGQAAADLRFHYMKEGEGEKVVQGRVEARSRSTFVTREQVGDGKNVSLFLESSADIVAERSVYFDYKGLNSGSWTGGDSVMGTTSASTQYYFAEGTTRAGFEEWLCLQNPGPGDITVDASYQLGPGQGDPVEKSYKLPARQRLTVSVNREIGPDKDCSVYLSGTDGFIAERPMYFLYGGKWDGGHGVLGAKSAATSWFFAEGYTGDGFEPWLCLQNPNSSSSPATVTFYTTAGTLSEKHVVVPPRSRLTLSINREAGADLEVSTGVVSDLPVVAERPMYFDFNGWTGGHAVTGF